MSAKQRTSLSLSSEALAVAQERRLSLGYESLSEYIEFLILEDARQKRRHLVVRDGNGVSHIAEPEPQAVPSALPKSSRAAAKGR